MLGKVSNIEGNWIRIELNKQEYDKIMNQLLETNMREIERIAKKIGSSESFTDEERLDIMAILADKQCMASFTAINNALDNKIHLIKNGKLKEVMEEPPKPPERKPNVVKEAEEEQEKDEHDEDVLEEEVTYDHKGIVEEVMEEKTMDFSPKTDSSFGSITEEEAKRVTERNNPETEKKEEKKGMFSKFRRNNGD